MVGSRTRQGLAGAKVGALARRRLPRGAALYAIDQTSHYPGVRISTGERFELSVGFVQQTGLCVDDTQSKMSVRVRLPHPFHFDGFRAFKNSELGLSSARRRRSDLNAIFERSYLSHVNTAGPEWARNFPLCFRQQRACLHLIEARVQYCNQVA